MVNSHTKDFFLLNNNIYSEKKGGDCPSSGSDFKIKQGRLIRLRPETGPECIVNHIAGGDLETVAADPGRGLSAAPIYESIQKGNSYVC